MSQLPPFLGFDGIEYPQISVAIQPGGTVAQGGTSWVLGVSQLGTLTLGGAEWSNVTDDLVGFSRAIGRTTAVDSANIGICSVTLDNEKGDYDSSNPNSPYLSANTLDSQQSSLEAVNTNGWTAGTNTAISSSATVGGYHGVRALQLNKIVSTGTAKANTDDRLCPPKTAVKATVWYRAGSTSRPCKVRVLFKDELGIFISDILSDPVTDNSTGWVQATVSGTSPALTSYASIELQAASDGNAVVGENHYADNVMLQTSGIEVGMPVQLTAMFEGITYGRFEGTVTNLVMDLGMEPYVTLELGDGLEALGRAHLSNAAPAGDLEYTGQRIGRLADVASWPTSKRILDTGQTRLGPTTFGAAALELMRKVEMTEFGLLFVDANGNLIFYDRHQTTSAARSTTVQIDLEDVELTALEAERSRDLAWNQVSITRGAVGEGDEPLEQVANDLTSQSRFGLLEFPGQVGELLPQDEDALAMAQGLLLRGRVPKLRIGEIRIEAITLDLWPSLLPLTLLDRIRVSRDYGPNTITEELLIQGLREEVSLNPPKWSFILTTSNPHAAPSLFVLGTSQVGSGRLGW